MKGIRTFFSIPLLAFSPSMGKEGQKCPMHHVPSMKFLRGLETVMSTSPRVPFANEVTMEEPGLACTT